MSSQEAPTRGWLLSMPWFQRRAGAAIGLAALLFVGVFMLRLTLGDNSGEAITMLFVLPISLLAVTFGLRGGVVSGLVGVALVTAWVQVKGVQLSSMGWISRILPLLLLGMLLGHAVNMLRRAELERRTHDIAELRHREAIEINDTLVQGMAAAKWSLEAGRIQAGLDTLNQTLALGHQLVSGLLRDTNMGVDTEPQPRLRDHDQDPER